MNCKFNRNNSESTRIYRKGSYNPKCTFWPSLHFYLYHIGYMIWSECNSGPEFRIWTKIEHSKSLKEDKNCILTRNLDQKYSFEETLFLSEIYDRVSKCSFGFFQTFRMCNFGPDSKYNSRPKLHLRSQFNTWYWTTRTCISTRGILPDFPKSGPEWTAWDRKFTLEIHYIRY